MVTAVIFIQMGFAWKKRICFLVKGFHDAPITCCWISRHGGALPQLRRIFCPWKRVCHCFLESHWKAWLEVRFSSLQPKAGGQVLLLCSHWQSQVPCKGVSMKQLFLSLTGPSGGEGSSHGGLRLRRLVPSALPPVSGPLLMPGSSPAPKSGWQCRGLWGWGAHSPVSLCSGLTTSSVCLLVRVVRVVLLFCCLFKKLVSVGSSVLLLAPVSRSFPVIHSSVGYLSFET